MKIPIDWLKEFIEFEASPEEIAAILTMRGLEVDSISEHNGRTVIEIELTPNRGDCASVIGVARELSAYFKSGIKLPETEYSESGTHASELYKLDIEIPEKCPAYYLKFIRDVSIEESPEWIRQRLELCGLRPLNNVIDITNYVLLELGQPLHAFDADKINEGCIKVRPGGKGEKIRTLDGEIRQLDKEDIIIADSTDAIAIGGVIGGEESSVTGQTRNILIESAFFSPRSISKTERRLGLKTEASYRFSRTVDPGGVKMALDRVVFLIEKYCSGKAAPGIICIDNIPSDKTQISVSIQKINSVLGTSITAKEAAGYISPLGFGVNADEDLITADIPSFRDDVTRPIDLIEEIARAYGYDNIEPTIPVSRIVTQLLKTKDQFLLCDEILRFSGYWEAVTHTLISSGIYERINPDSDTVPVKIDNPINVNMDILRPNILFGLLPVLRYNIYHKQSPIRFFERGPVFFEESDSLQEKEQVAFAARSEDFHDAKKAIISILEKYRQDFSLEYNSPSDYFDRNKNASVFISGRFAGQFGLISNQFLKAYKLDNSSFIGGFLFTETFFDENFIDAKYSAWSQYPSLYRDLSLVVPNNLTYATVYDKIVTESGFILKKVTLTDTYRDEKLGKDRKSMTFGLEFNSPDKTLTAVEVDSIIEKILTEVKNVFGITLRPD
ncbi:MAG: phenylalanine--tRNA ligase subunit beta [Elusimicrobiota bacterium]